MDLHSVLFALGGVGLSVLGWFARVLYEATQSLRRDLSALETKIGTDYVRYDRLQDALRPVVAQLNRIENALSHKVDKP